MHASSAQQSKAGEDHRVCREHDPFSGVTCQHTFISLICVFKKMFAVCKYVVPAFCIPFCCYPSLKETCQATELVAISIFVALCLPILCAPSFEAFPSPCRLSCWSWQGCGGMASVKLRLQLRAHSRWQMLSQHTGRETRPTPL